MTEAGYDVVVVGGGNAALCAALAASEHGARVLVLERAPEPQRGGNSFFTGGIVRFPHKGIDDLLKLLPELSGEELSSIELSPYSKDDYFEDMARVTEDLADPDLVVTLVNQARPTIDWLHTKRIRFGLSFGRHSYKQGQKHHFWGGASIEFLGGGPGLIEGLFEAAKRQRIETWYGARATKLTIGNRNQITGVRVRRKMKSLVIRARAVVLACGGFEANPEMRAKYLGPNWDLARVRGTEFNTGDGIAMALEIGAQPYGHWSGCHAVAWDANAPLTGDRKIGDAFSRHSYPLGIVVNKRGERFIDEGADYMTHTYAKYGKEILRQPEQIAFQIFDSKVVSLLRDSYRIRETTKVQADSFEALADRLGVDRQNLVQTIRAFNASIVDKPFDPSARDGKGTVGIYPPKSNWAQRIDAPPYLGFPVTTGITFTFGGLRINPDSQVVDSDNAAIPGLFAAGELVGGLFYHNYPSGTGLMSGAVFGRIAGNNAALLAGSGLPVQSAISATGLS